MLCVAIVFTVFHHSAVPMHIVSCSIYSQIYVYVCACSRTHKTSHLN